MENKRQNKRYRTRAYCGVFERMTLKSLGCLVDLSVDGIQIMTAEDLSIGKTYKLKIAMHKTIEDSRDIIVDAVCAWKKISVDPTLFITGFVFEPIDEITLRRIRKFTKSSAFRYPETLEIDLN